jgi:glycosyltransferase involved in cell wall biosynthesis
MPRPLRGRFSRRIFKALHWLVTFQLVGRLRERRNYGVDTSDPEHTYKLIRESGLFDAQFYRDSNPDVARARVDPLVHYINLGTAQGFDPNPLFDTSFYLENNPEVARTGINPLEHYLTAGGLAGCDPNPHFNTSLYADDLSDSLRTHTTPLAHYMSDPAVARGLRRLLTNGDAQLSWTECRRQLVQSTFCYTADRKLGHAQLKGSHDHFVPAIVVVAQDAQPYESQLIALSVVRELLTAYDVEVFVLLKRGGTLTERFLALAPTVVLQDDDGPERSPDLALEELLTTLRTRGAEVAMCFGVTTGDVTERLKALGLRVVTMIHELPSEFEDGITRRLQQAYLNSAHVVFPAEFLQKRITSAFSLFHDSTLVRPHSILEPNPFVDEREFARLQLTKQFHIPSSASIVLGYGRASLLKGFDLFIQTARVVIQRMVDNEIHFVWVGEEDCDYTALCLEDIARCGLVDRVHALRPQAHPGLFYAAADVFVSASREDAFPMVCLEAMEAGLPVIAFEDAGGIGEAIGNDAGILVPYLDVQAMSVAVERVIDDPHLRSTLGSCGKQRIKERFGLRQYASFLLSLMYPDTDLDNPAFSSSYYEGQLVTYASAV